MKGRALRGVVGRRSATVLLLGWMFTGCQGGQVAPAGRGGAETGKGETTVAENEGDLRALIERKDYGAVDLAEGMGAKAESTATEALRNPDREVRQIALRCLDAALGVEAKKRIASALDDPDASVRTTALQLLQDGDNRPVAATLVAALRNPDPAVRGGAATLLGKTGDPSFRQPLLELLGRGDVREVRDAVVLAAARLGHEPSQEELARALDATDPHERFVAIRNLVDAGARRFDRRVYALIGDRMPAYNVGTIDKPRSARVCDAVVNALGGWLDVPLSFPLDRYAVYTDDQLAEARKAFGERLKIAGDPGR